jgi:hypothetical protein
MGNVFLGFVCQITGRLSLFVDRASVRVLFSSVVLSKREPCIHACALLSVVLPVRVGRGGVRVPFLSVYCVVIR